MVRLGNTRRPRLHGAAAVLVGAAVLLAGPPGGRAQSEPSESRTVTPPGVSGSLTLKNFSHFYETPTDHRLFRDEGSLQVQWARRFGAARFRLVGEARGDDDGFTDGLHFTIPETAERRSILSLREAVAAFQVGHLDLAVGKQFFAWGTADAHNPSDNLNPYDYLDPIDSEKMGVYSAAARLTGGASSLTLVLVPVFTPSRLPLAASRWVPPPPGGTVAVVDNRELPSTSAGNMEYAARFRTTAAGWDLSVSYFEGFEHTPAVKLSAAEVAPGVTVPRVTPVFTRERVPGFDFSTILFRQIEVHGEAVARLVDRNGRDDRFRAIVGLNYTWDPGVAWLQDLVFVAEYYREKILASDERSAVVGADRLIDVGAPLLNNLPDETVIGRLALRFTEKTQLKVTAAVDLSRSVNYYTQARVSHKVTDTLHADAGVDVFTGEQDTFWGRWGSNDRFFFAVKYFF